MVAGDKRRKVTEKSLAKTLDYLRNKILEVPEPRDRCLIALLYLSGRRISEVIGLKNFDFEITEDSRILFTTFNEKTFRSKPGKNYVIPRRGKFYEEITPQFSLTSDSGKALGGFVLEYLGTLKSEDYLFSPERGSKYPHITRQMAYIIVRRALIDVWPHLLRHIRFTSYARHFREDPLKMHPLTFHKHFESTLEYIHREETKESVHEV